MNRARRRRFVIGRRPLFFAALAMVCLLLVWPTPRGFRWVDWTFAGLAVFWAVALGFDEAGTPAARSGSPRVDVPQMPFGPPPSPGEPSQPRT